ncbi:MAG: hypothetical protein JNM24_02585 [Bdellovibrionaceae bacterium]|nr:hypothetical protein [Pseudobdellovibrionaceae bacterium]
MRIFIFLIALLLLKTNAFAGHVGCATIYERSLCETETTFQYKSETVTWEMTKDDFKNKLVSFLDQLLPNHGARLGTVFLWVNDFNSQSSLRVQVWAQDRSFILDIPTDINTVKLDDPEAQDISIRGAGSLPYPVDFGYTLGEVIVSCVEDCSQVHVDWLAAAGMTQVQLLLPKMYLVRVPKFNEAKTLEIFKTKFDFSGLFSNVELSPVLEGNGFREMAFSVYF